MALLFAQRGDFVRCCAYDSETAAAHSGVTQR
jgi:hypothetical protein